MQNLHLTFDLTNFFSSSNSNSHLSYFNLFISSLNIKYNCSAPVMFFLSPFANMPDRTIDLGYTFIFNGKHMTNIFSLIADNKITFAQIYNSDTHVPYLYTFTDLLVEPNVKNSVKSFLVHSIEPTSKINEKSVDLLLESKNTSIKEHWKVYLSFMVNNSGEWRAGIGVTFTC